MAVRLRSVGTVSPINSVDVKAQTNSIIAKVMVRDGQFVRAGEALFILDARTEEANIAKALAQVAKDNAALADAQRQLKRSQDLLAQKFISQGQVDTALANVDGWVATLNADKAALDAAKVALSYSRISAPLSGRVGVVNVSAGAAVQANITNLLTITQINPIAVTFTLPQRNIADALGALKGGGAPVTATLADNGGTFKGKLQFVDSVVDPASGAVKAKAYFKNDEEKLWPGAFVEIQQTLRELKDALVIPQAAVIYGARGAFAYAVEDGKAVTRQLKIVQSLGAEVAVTGLALGESIILDGRQNVRPGSPVVERSKDAPKDPQGGASAAALTASKASAP
jgi:RND family efflux transporter MFP subunit